MINNYKTDYRDLIIYFNHLITIMSTYKEINKYNIIISQYDYYRAI